MRIKLNQIEFLNGLQGRDVFVEVILCSMRWKMVHGKGASTITSHGHINVKLGIPLYLVTLNQNPVEPNQISTLTYFCLILGGPSTIPM